MKKLRYILLSIILGITATCSYAQNLVPNYSFEVYDTCPTSAGQIYYSSPWVDPTNTSSDYFNSCNSPGSTGTPLNGFGNQNPKDGIAYAGFIAYSEPSGVNYREYIQVKLTDTLLTDTCYKIVFYVSVADNNKYATSKLSAYLSDTAISACYQCFFPFTPQINYYDVLGIGNSSSWYKVEGVFQAQGGEEYMTIGNFNTDAASAPIIVNTGATGFAYYYIDSVSLTQVTCPIDIGIEENQNTKPFKLFPNPNNGTMSLQYLLNTNDKAEMKIYDITGRLVKETKLNTTVTQSEINSDLNKGIYMYQIIVNDQPVQSDQLIIIK